MMVTHFVHNRRKPGRASLQRSMNLGTEAVPGARKAPGDRLLEADVQRDVLKLLRSHPQVAWAHRFNSRVLDVPDKHSKTGFRPMRMSFKGCSDILGQLKDGRFFACECKSSDGSLTDDQAAFLSLVNKYHGIGFVARKIDDVLEFLPLTGGIP